MNVLKEFEGLIGSVIDDLGSGLAESKEELAAYGAERAEVLAKILEADEPGFEQALIAARNSLAMKAGIAAGNMTHNSGFWKGMFAGALRFAAVSMVGAPIVASPETPGEAQPPAGTEGFAGTPPGAEGFAGDPTAGTGNLV